MSSLGFSENTASSLRSVKRMGKCKVLRCDFRKCANICAKDDISGWEFGEPRARAKCGGLSTARRTARLSVAAVEMTPLGWWRRRALINESRLCLVAGAVGFFPGAGVDGVVLPFLAAAYQEH